MPFAVDPDRPLPRALTRVARALTATARDHLAKLEADPVAAVHDARRDIRAARAALRLMRRALGEEEFDRQEDLLRRAGSLLSEHRDAHVLTDALDDLLAGSPEPESAPTIRAALSRRHLIHREPLSLAAAAAILELNRFDDALDTWPRRGDKLDKRIAQSLADTLRRARDAARNAQPDSPPDTLHAVRKRAKDARDQLRILGPFSPKRFEKLARRYAEVADLLGRSRDLVLLAHALDDLSSQIPDFEEPIAELTRAAITTQSDLAAQALDAAARIDAPPRKTARLIR